MLFEKYQLMVEFSFDKCLHLIFEYFNSMKFVILINF